MNRQYLNLSLQVRAVIAGLGKFLSTLAQNRTSVVPAPATAVIGIARAKQIFLLAAEDFGIPSAEGYPRATTDQTALADHMAAVWNFAQTVLNDYPAELPEGFVLHSSEIVDWQVEAISALGWDVRKGEDGVSFTFNYPTR